MANLLLKPPRPPEPFIGRVNELEWLERETSPHKRRSPARPIVITGEGGVGKTSLVAKYSSEMPPELEPLWIDCKDWAEGMPNMEEALRARRSIEQGRLGLSVVLDEASLLPGSRFTELFYSIANYKAVRNIVITSRNSLDPRGDAVLRLTRLSETEAEALIRQTISMADLDERSALRLLAAANGLPIALSWVAGMARSMSSEQLRRVLAGNIYDISDVYPGEERSLERTARPLIISANDAMIEQLKKEPKEVLKLSPRKFEELIADLLRDMGHNVTLTQATRDGGTDILASMKTELGELLCLVDAKRYREDRKIGVSMVRTLYGTLAHYQASSAMLVTTSSYSKDARAMQEEHRYQLSLKDYTDVAGWIQRYGSRRRN